MADTSSLLAKLNPQQLEAVTTADGPMLVIAGAGSGKTRVITHRIAWLIRECGVAPWQIFAATFTNKAAEEMRARVARLIPGADAARLAISTFHSLCVMILRREAHHIGLTSRFTICDDTDQSALVKDCLRQQDVPASVLRPEQVLHFIAAAKIRMLDPEAARKEFDMEMGPLMARIYAQYQERLLCNNAVDFDDLIGHVVKIFQTQPDVLAAYQERWRYILVDEYQDTNRVQFELVHLLASAHGNLCVVGDEDQSIYSWRGAEIENLIKFPELFPAARVIRLEQNYRSTETILQAASAVIAHNSQRLGKNLWSDRGMGEPIAFIAGMSERDEAAQVIQSIERLHRLRGIPLRDIAIFYRVNALSRVFEDQLRANGIPYRVIGGIKFYDRAEVKDLLAYMRLAVNPRDGVALARVINRPARGVGDRSLAKIYDTAVGENLSMWDILLRLRDGKMDGVSAKARTGALNVVALVEGWREWAETHPPRELAERILRETGYEESLGEGSDIEVISRRENIGELLSALEEFHKADPGSTLVDFLERVALVNAQDDLTGEDCVSLMSLHCAKGLEYRVVFMVAMEEPIFPNQRAVGDQGHLEEERRLYYVGITRAKDLLVLSRADCRSLYGRPTYNAPSVFLTETPAELVRSIEEARREWAQMANEATDEEKPERGRPKAPIAPESEGLFAIGARVRHKQLGEGEVIAAAGEGDRRKVKIRFDAGLELELLERYGGLERANGSDMPF